MKPWQFSQAVSKAGNHPGVNPRFGFRIVWDTNTEEVLKVKAVYLHDDPLDFKKEIVLDENDPRAKPFMDKAKQELVKV